MASSHSFSLGSVEIYHEEVLGVGSYGKVCKAKYGQLSCAVKLLHDTMFETNDPGIFKFAENFEKECQFLSLVRHPNIVQYLGTWRNPRTQRLALLTEMMDENLTKFLERSTGLVSYHIQLNICRDVALALSYLHSNDIIHRDLSSNNVLLIGDGSRAKVTDFGMSKLVSMYNPRMTPLTVCPGATVYMPPEALTTPPHYSSKLDCFSHGVLTIQVLTKNFPNPGDAHQAVEDPNYPPGSLFVQLPETQRRKNDVDLIEQDHPLKPLALHCLHNRASERPSANEICAILADLKSKERYLRSVDSQTSVAQNLKVELEQTTKSLEQERAHHKSEIEQRDKIARQLENELTKKDTLLFKERADYEKKLQIIRQENAQREKHINNDIIRRKSHLDEQLAQIQKERANHKRELEEMRQAIDELRAHHRDELEQIATQQRSYPHEEKEDVSEQEHLQGATPATKVQTVPSLPSWRHGKPTPSELTSAGGTAIAHGNIAYLSDGKNIYSLSVSDCKWVRLPPCPYYEFAMAVVDNNLTTIGGQDLYKDHVTNFLLSLTESTSLLQRIATRFLNSWKEAFPPMPTARIGAAAVTTTTHLLVAGGRKAMLTLGQDMDVVEVLDINLRQWYTANSLPQAVPYPLIAICKETIYLTNDSTVFSCSIEDLLKSITTTDFVWTTHISNIPADSAYLVTVKGHLLAIGGYDNLLPRKPIAAIHCYDMDTNSWSVIGNLPTPLGDVLAAVLPDDTVIVAGGYAKERELANSIYISE